MRAFAASRAAGTAAAASAACRAVAAPPMKLQQVAALPVLAFLVPKRHASTVKAPALTRESLNPQLLKAEYAVRGELVIRADTYRKKLATPGHGLPFDEVVSCNIGNPQELGQEPLTFPRQVLSLVTYPKLVASPQAEALFPADAIARARKYLKAIPGGTGAYSNSQGVEVVREEVAAYIRERDGGVDSDPSKIFLTDGASPGVKMILQSIIRNEKDGILIPIPQYPLYSASIALSGGSQVSYYLDEERGWGLEVSELERALKAGRERGLNVRALVVINPGNPTGQCLTEANMKAVAEFCAREKLLLMADEVYQSNIYGSTPFTSFKKVVKTSGPQAESVELVSFHSVSKGFLGECGRRGGYMELHNVADDVKMELYKLASISLCSNLDGQIMTGLMVNPPKAGEPSHDLYAKERDEILGSLQRRAVKLTEALNEMEGVVCNTVEGALYAFPLITLPKKAVEAARKAGKAPDVFYCLELLDHTGICVVPGSGFGQRENTFHFRTTILPRENKIEGVVARMKKFHTDFMHRYA